MNPNLKNRQFILLFFLYFPSFFLFPVFLYISFLFSLSSVGPRIASGGTVALHLQRSTVAQDGTNRFNGARCGGPDLHH
jgi:hypothetical protein